MSNPENTYDIGDLVRVTSTFTLTADDTAVDPTTVTYTVKDPSGNETEYTYAGGEVTRSSTGVFYKDVSIDEAGRWWIRVDGAGACVAAAEHSLLVRTNRVTVPS